MSAADERETPPRGLGARCPTCRATTLWESNPHRPFCSVTCRLIDLGAWIDERYRIEAGEPDDVS
jgi:endogenous inhibitor of DNA gyrase (YacG/DUF329 family)